MSYQLGEKLGSGSFGTVYKAVMNGKEYAVKKFDDKDDFEKEANIIEHLLHHPHENVVKIYHIDKIAMLIVFELCKGDFYDLVKSKGDNFDDFGWKLLEIAKGMEHLHTHHITHRDLKLENVLVGYDGKLKVADFGLGFVFPYDRHHVHYSRSGSNCYQAPEVLKRQVYSHEIDVFSFGMLIYGAVHHFDDDVEQVQFDEMIRLGDRPPINNKSPFDELMTMCWNQNPALRPTFTEIIRYLENSQLIKTPHHEITDPVHFTEEDYIHCPICEDTMDPKLLRDHFAQTHPEMATIEKNTEMVMVDFQRTINSANDLPDIDEYQQDRNLIAVKLLIKFEMYGDPELNIVMFSDMSGRTCGFCEFYHRHRQIEIAWVGVKDEKYFYGIIEQLLIKYPNHRFVFRLELHTMVPRKRMALLAALKHNKFVEIINKDEHRITMMKHGANYQRVLIPRKHLGVINEALARRNLIIDFK